jgi:kynurenine formamidase
MASRRIELSHVIADGAVTYPGLPAASICDFWTREQSRAHYADEQTSCHIARLDMVANTGTYIDAPFHFFEDGADIADLDLSCCTGLPALRVDCRSSTGGVTASVFRGMDVRGKAVLIHTGWDRHFGSEAYGGAHPYLQADAATLLRDEGVALVGIDSVNIDDRHGGSRPVHTILLGAGIPIVEHLTGLGDLPASGFEFSAAPARFRGVGSFPVRAYAVLGETS